MAHKYSRHSKRSKRRSSKRSKRRSSKRSKRRSSKRSKRRSSKRSKRRPAFKLSKHLEKRIRKIAKSPGKTKLQKLKEMDKILDRAEKRYSNSK